MKNKIILILSGILLLGIFIVYQTNFILRTGDLAVVTRFGRPLRALHEPGLYRKLPWPVEQLHVFDGRLRSQENVFEETYTADQYNIVALTYIYWRIADPILFLERAGTPTVAADGLEGLVRSHKNTVIGQYVFSDLVNADPAASRLESIEAEILAPVADEARLRYGVEVAMLGIRKLNLPESVTEKVYERMRAERGMAADRFRAEGEEESARVRAQAGQQREALLVEAEVKAMGLMAEGDAAAAEYYAVFESQPELAIFLRKLETLESTLREQTTLILGTDTAPYDLLKDEKLME